MTMRGVEVPAIAEAVSIGAVGGAPGTLTMVPTMVLVVAPRVKVNVAGSPDAMRQSPLTPAAFTVVFQPDSTGISGTLAEMTPKNKSRSPAMGPLGLLITRLAEPPPARPAAAWEAAPAAARERDRVSW